MSVFHGIKMNLHMTPLKLMKYNVIIYFINLLFMPVLVLCHVILTAHHKYSNPLTYNEDIRSLDIRMHSSISDYYQARLVTTSTIIG